MLRVVLADDHHVLRHGLRVLLEVALPCQVVGEAGEGAAAVALVEQQHPDLLVTDMRLPDISGLEVIRRARRGAPQTRVVVLSMHADENHVREALRAGADAYVLKEAHADELIYALREVVAGRRYLSPPLSERAIDAYIRQVAEPAVDPYDTLSPRERDVLLLSVQGLTNTQIAERLGLSARTIESHRATMLRKLGLRTQTDLIRYALQRGMIT